MKDRFSGHSKDYARFRPGYPGKLIRYITALCENTDKVWDCATGNGQMARMVSPFFDNVYASDMSAEQIAAAPATHSIEYSVQPAEQTNYPDDFFDLIIVAQAIHWFDFDLFFKEARRVLKPTGLFVMTGYGLTTIDEAIDQVVLHLYEDILGQYWDPERRYIEQGYLTIPFPFREIKTPSFTHEPGWGLDRFINYLGTWSALKQYQQKHNRNPLSSIRKELTPLWTLETTVKFPILLRVGHHNN